MNESEKLSSSQFCSNSSAIFLIFEEIFLQGKLKFLTINGVTSVAF